MKSELVESIRKKKAELSQNSITAIEEKPVIGTHRQTTIETNEQKYTASSQFQENIDLNLFKWIRRDEELKTYIPFSDLPEDDKEIKEMTIKIVLEINETYPKKETLTLKVIND